MQPTLPPSSSSSNRKEFFMGVGIWLLVNALLICLGAVLFFVIIIGAYEGISDSTSTILLIVLAVAPLVINIGGLVLLGLRRRQMALGALTVFAALLVCVVLSGVFISAACAPPRAGV